MLRVWLVLLLLLPRDVRSTLTHSDLSCVNDYVRTIWCAWNSTAWLMGQRCFVQVTRDTRNGLTSKNCSLNTTSTCMINMSTRFHFADKLVVKVYCNGTQVDSLMDYRPGRYVKLHPPDQLNVSGNNMTWSRGVQFPKFITAYVFEVQVKAEQQSWELVKPRRVDGTSVLLDTVCEGDCKARVRVKPLDPINEEQIRGFWSDWSPAVSWRPKDVTTRGSRQLEKTDTYMFNSSHPAVVGSLGGFAVFIFVLLITLSVYRHKCGLKMGCEHVPDPSKYFHPLISEHKGNFQDWLSPQHPASLFLSAQSCDCEFSAVDEVCDVSDITLLDVTPLDSGNPGAALSDSSQLSSGVSNMGYFYSEHQLGSVCLDSCPVYFTYPGGALQTSLSYERLHQAMPTSPDSGFGMEVEEEEGVVSDGVTGKGQAWERGGVNMQHLVSFVVSSADSTRIVVPPSFAELTPWHKEPESPGIGSHSEVPEGAGVRPSSMVVQPCSGGYLTLKEMQKYSNKSI